MTKKKAEKLAKYITEPKECFEKMYQDYRFKDMDVLYSDYVSGCYIYTRMHRKN